MMPSWLGSDDGGNNNNNSSSENPHRGEQAGDGRSAAGRMLDATVEDGIGADANSDLPQLILTMRLLNLGVSIAIIFCSVFVAIRFPHPAKLVLAIYATFGGLLVCLLETQLQVFRVAIAVNFGFLFSPAWRLLFYLLLALIAWSYKTFLGMIVAIGILFVSIYNTYILIRYPSYRKVRDQIAEDEDKQIKAKIASEVKKQAVKDLTTRLTGT